MSTLEQMTAGVGLYTRLRDLLESEQRDLVQQELAELENANRQREALLAEIADWEGDIAHILGRDVDDSGEGATLSQLIAGYPEQTRHKAEQVLTRLEAVAREARKLAKMNHILVERNLATVELTLDAFTGGPRAKTYDAYGGVSKGGRQNLLARKG